MRADARAEESFSVYFQRMINDDGPTTYRGCINYKLSQQRYSINHPPTDHWAVFLLALGVWFLDTTVP